MKTMTTNLKYFSALAFVFSIVFFYLLYTSLAAESYNNIWLLATLFGLALLVSGFALGYHDLVRNSRLDLGFRYHLMTFMIVNAIGLASLFVAMGVNKDTLLYGLLPVSFWGLGLLVHYYFSSKSIKGMDKKNLFD